MAFTARHVVLGALLLAAAYALSRTNFHVAAKIILVVALVYGSASAIAQELDGPVRLSQAKVVQSTGPVERGRFVTPSSYAVYLGGDGDPCEIRADDVEQVTFHKVPDDEDDDEPPSLSDRFIDLF